MATSWKKGNSFFLLFLIFDHFQVLAKTWKETLKIKIFSPKWSIKGFLYDPYFSSYDNSFLCWSRDFVKFEISIQGFIFRTWFIAILNLRDYIF